MIFSALFAALVLSFQDLAEVYESEREENGMELMRWHMRGILLGYGFVDNLVLAIVICQTKWFS